MNFIRHIRAAWQYACLMPSPDVLNEAAEWTEEDSAAYKHFMENTGTGQKLRIRSRAMMIQSAVSATQASQQQAHRCGWASGITATFTWLDSHLQLSPASAHEASEEPAQGAAELLEQLAP